MLYERRFAAASLETCPSTELHMRVPFRTTRAARASSRVHLHIVHSPRGLTAGATRRGLKRAAEADVDGTARGCNGPQERLGVDEVV